MISPKPFLISAAVLLGTAGVANARPTAPPAFTIKVFAGAPNRATSGPDDIASLNGHVFVGWQNGIGPKGQPAPKTHKTSSLLVEYGHTGRPVARWSLVGKVDGITGDPGLHAVIATVNEDGNTSLYTINPRNRRVSHYHYSPSPDASGKSPVMTGGGTDDVTVVGSKILISASAPTRKGRAAAFVARLNSRTHVAKLSSAFADNARATDGLSGASVKLSLTDPDSNATVPASAGLYGGDFMLDGQADQQLVFAHGIGGHPSLTRLLLNYNGKRAGVDDVRWAQSAGQTLFVVDNAANKIYTVKGPFSPGDAVAAMDSVGTSSFGTQVDTLNPGSGDLTPFITGLKAAKGLLFGP